MCAANNVCAVELASNSVLLWLLSVSVVACRAAAACVRACVRACVLMQPQKERTRTLRIAGCRCPLCRKAFSLSDLIRIVKPKEGGCGGGAGPSGGGAGACSSSKGKEAADPVLDEPRQQQKRPGQVAWCPAATEVCLSLFCYLACYLALCATMQQPVLVASDLLGNAESTRKHSQTLTHTHHTHTHNHTHTHTHTLYSPTLTRKWP